MTERLRTEHDSIGSREVACDAYFGIHTARAIDNFPISGITIASHPELLHALAYVKEAAALANCELGLLDTAKAAAIAKACEDIRAGQLIEHFVVDVIQGGAGTSTNMNANEVIANRALEHMGRKRGDYDALHPLDDVNMSQSTNDVYPTAIKLGLHVALGKLIASLLRAETAFGQKGNQFDAILKVGRTQLQDAVPMTLGQEFSAFAMSVAEDIRRVRDVRCALQETHLGGTAIGTGLNVHPDYPAMARAHLSRLTGIPFAPARDFIEATQDTGSLVDVSAVLRRVAVRISKICNDLRLLSSGPRCGIGELNLPAVQAGSSMMPGKVNPVIPEAVTQVAFEIIGGDVTISMSAEAGQLQLNAFEPIVAHVLFRGISQLSAALDSLATRCVDGITANSERSSAFVDASASIVAALTPYIGYAQAAALSQEALSSGKSIRELVEAKDFVPGVDLVRLLQPERLTGEYRERTASP